MIQHPIDRIEAYTRAGWWGLDTLDDLFRGHVMAQPDAVALADPLNRAALTDGAPRRWTWAELDQAVDRLAAAFVVQGLKPDDVVVLHLPNIAELALAYLATLRLGLIASPFPVQYREYEIEQLVNFVEAKAYVTVTRLGDRANAASVAGLRDKLPGLRAVLAFGDNVPEGVVALDAVLAQPHDEAALEAYVAERRPNANEVVTICWTSGTESQPKGVPRTHNDWIAIAYATVDGAELTRADHLLNPFPMVNMAGIGGMFVPWLITGAEMVMHQPFDLPTFLKQVVVEQITYTVAPPALLNLLLAKPEILAQADIRSLRTIGSGSAPLSPWMVKTWQDKHNIEVTNFFGSNEGTALISTAKDISDPEQRAQYFPRFGAEGYHWSGRVPQGLKTKLVDIETGSPISEPGKPGELCIQGPTVFAGYIKDTPTPIDADGYFRTGDMFEIAGPEGDPRYYRFVDRVKDIVNRGGMKISAAEVESLLQGHPKVAECAVVPYADEVLGEKACVFVVPRPNETVTLDDLAAHLREKKVASYKLPERLEIIAALPRNPVGKILKRELRERVRSTA